MPETITVKPSSAKEAIRALIMAKRPGVVWGSPGIGKSDLMRHVAKEMGLEIRDVRAVLFDPVDLRGLPMVSGGLSAWAVPDWLPREVCEECGEVLTGSVHKENGVGNNHTYRTARGLLFIDELNRAPILVQNAFFQLILDRRLGDYVLPEGWVIMVACNRESDGGGVVRMPQALNNRFVHLNLEVDLEDWCNWAVTNGIDPLVIAFLRFRPVLLHNFSKDEHAFPTPRSWQFVSDVLNQGSSQEIELALIAGTVGHAAAVEFMAFVKLVRTLPSIDAILLNPTTEAVPQEVGTLYAVASALSTRATANNFGAICKYLERCRPEYAVYCVKDAILRDESIRSTPEFTKWSIAHAMMLG